ncbi:AraC family transcriptional regulator [Alkalimarinus coralli]|uniref:AraC family transcriptional regulator n=1 Tax=Alkalimarinus coralli TaxID=2935863 RepID=UPI00202AF754|nr:AraC family transcriptional regulator [Alkalimarinus coralli]
MAQEQSLFFKKSDILPFVEMRRADRSSACYHTHSHDEFSFGVIDEGEAEYRNQRCKNHIGSGMTVTINPADAHSCNPKEGLWSYRMLFVDTHWIGELQQEMLSFHSIDYLPFPNLYESDAKTYHSFGKLFEILVAETNPLVAESLLIQFLERRFMNSASLAKASALPDLMRVKQVKELIMDQLDVNISLDEFSAHSGLSRYHLIRSFKHAYGQSPHAFQLDQRIKKAKSLLQRGESIVDTASVLGFADQSHFQRNFKKRLAVTPRQYQAFFV